MTAQPEEKLGIVWMRPGREPVYFQLPLDRAILKAALAIFLSTGSKRAVWPKCKKEYTRFGQAAIMGVLQNKKNNR